MNIETYTTCMIRLYICLLVLALSGELIRTARLLRNQTANVQKIKRIWRDTFCLLLYLISALFYITIADLACNDPSSPNFEQYKNWGFKNFMFQDIKILLIWLAVGAALHTRKK